MPHPLAFRPSPRPAPRGTGRCRRASAWGRVGVAAALAALAVLAVAVPAHAAPGMEVGIEDERLLLSEPWRAAGVIEEWKALGMETVRLIAAWDDLSPGSHRLRRPSGFDARDPSDPRYRWSQLDQAVNLVVAAGMKPMLTVTGPAPYWATADPRRRQGQFRPRARDFGRFALAVTRRYGHLVDRYLIWNEPNQPGWLLPQRDCRDRGRATACRPSSPHQYRRLFAAARRAIRRADDTAQIVFGELAPVGDDPVRSPWRPMSPLPFLRALACVDDRFRPTRSGPCRGFRPLRADAFGYHPHGKKQAPDQRNPDREEAQLADLPRLFRTLDRVSRRGRLRAPAATRRRFDVLMTEFGFQTRPPDRAAGVTLAQQARYVQEAAYMLWRHPRVRSLTHYQWEDEVVMRNGPKSGYGGWQSGLRFFSGRPKPVFAVFAAPLVYDRRRAQLWGQVRPGVAQQVFLQERGARSGAWRAVEQVSTDARGYFVSDYPVDDRADYRVSWVEPPELLEAKPRVRVSGVLRIDARQGRLRTSTAR